MRLPALLSLLGCIDSGITAIDLDAIAVVNGDFDDIAATLARNDIGSVAYNGYIAQSTTWVGDEPPQRDDPGRTVESLFTEPVPNEAKFQIEKFNIVFLNSGTRGLNAFRYNYSREADDSLLIDPTAMQNACDYVDGGGSMFVTDWAYDLIEFCWPDAIEFLDDDKVVDAAQLGVAGSVLADIEDEALRELLGTSVINVEFNYSDFAVIEKAGADTEVLVRGDILYDPADSEEPTMFVGAPLAVRIPVSRGQVVFSSFHMFPQTAALADALLFRGLDGLERGDGDKSQEAAGE
ncbi:MAG: hypothetical protein EXR71_08065 [Myxococcales bacterium]|nr:hypothetical protein [Myxococcales bacterium]